MLHPTPAGRAVHRRQMICGMIALAIIAVSGCDLVRKSEKEAGQVLGRSIPTVSPIDGQSLQDRIGELSGNVVLVDFWATWCPSCMESFPHIQELQRKYAAQGLVVLTVSLNASGELDSVREFLRTQVVEQNCYISRHGAGVASFDEFQIDAGSIPYYVLYDRTSNRRFAWTTATEELEVRLRELLAESASKNVEHLSSSARNQDNSKP